MNKLTKNNEIEKRKQILMERIKSENDSRYVNLSPNEVMKIVIDSSNKGKYVLWVLEEYLKGNIQRFEDMSRVKQALTLFKNNLSKFTEPQKQLNKMSFQELETLVSPYQDVLTQNEIKRMNKEKIWSEIETIYEGPEGKIYIPRTEQASIFLGQGTKWCTSATDGNMFESYNKKGKLYVFILPEKDEQGREIKYQLHFETGQFMDIKDHPVEPDAFEQNLILRKIKAVFTNEQKEKICIDNPMNYRLFDEIINKETNLPSEILLKIKDWIPELVFSNKENVVKLISAKNISGVFSFLKKHEYICEDDILNFIALSPELFSEYSIIYENVNNLLLEKTIENCIKNGLPPFKEMCRHKVFWDKISSIKSNLFAKTSFALLDKEFQTEENYRIYINNGGKNEANLLFLDKYKAFDTIDINSEKHVLLLLKIVNEKQNDVSIELYDFAYNSLMKIFSDKNMDKYSQQKAILSELTVFFDENFTERQKIKMFDSIPENLYSHFFKKLNPVSITLELVKKAIKHSDSDNINNIIDNIPDKFTVEEKKEIINTYFFENNTQKNIHETFLIENEIYYDPYETFRGQKYKKTTNQNTFSDTFVKDYVRTLFDSEEKCFQMIKNNPAFIDNCKICKKNEKFHLEYMKIVCTKQKFTNLSKMENLISIINSKTEILDEVIQHGLKENNLSFNFIRVLFNNLNTDYHPQRKILKKYFSFDFFMQNTGDISLDLFLIDNIFSSEERKILFQKIFKEQGIKFLKSSYHKKIYDELLTEDIIDFILHNYKNVDDIKTIFSYTQKDVSKKFELILDKTSKINLGVFSEIYSYLFSDFFQDFSDQEIFDKMTKNMNEDEKTILIESTSIFLMKEKNILSSKPYNILSDFVVKNFKLMQKIKNKNMILKENFSVQKL